MILVHMGSGDRRKEWDEGEWKRLLELVGGEMIFTGLGEEERERIDRVIRGRKEWKNCADRYSFGELKKVIAGAELVLCVDSVVGHLAAEAGVRCMVLYRDAEEIMLWRPNGNKTLLFPLTCSADEIYPHLHEFMCEEKYLSQLSGAGM